MCTLRSPGGGGSSVEGKVEQTQERSPFHELIAILTQLIFPEAVRGARRPIPIRNRAPIRSAADIAFAHLFPQSAPFAIVGRYLEHFMRAMLSLSAAAVAFLISPAFAQSQTSSASSTTSAENQSSASASLPSVDRIGDVYEIRSKTVTSSSGGNGSTGSSEDNSELVERVVGLQGDGVVLEFDLPSSTSAEDRARQWQLPAQVLKSPGRPFQLLNASELDARVHTWLTSARFTEAACGHWIFTWTAIKIECDPQSVLLALEPFDLRLADLREGAPYSEPGTLGNVPLHLTNTASTGATFVAELQIDPEAVRRERAEADMAVAEMTGRAPVSLEAALQAHASETISGTIETTIETDPSGRVTRRVQVEQLKIDGAGGPTSLETATTTTTDRQLVPVQGAQ